MAGPAATDPGESKQWGMAVIGAEAAWKVATGAGVTIAVVDTGVDLTHEDLKAKVVSPLPPGANFVNLGQPPQDDNGHGTTWPVSPPPPPTTGRAWSGWRRMPRSCRSRCSTAAGAAAAPTSTPASGSPSTTAPQ